MPPKRGKGRSGAGKDEGSDSRGRGRGRGRGGHYSEERPREPQVQYVPPPHQQPRDQARGKYQPPKQYEDAPPQKAKPQQPYDPLESMAGLSLSPTESSNTKKRKMAPKQPKGKLGRPINLIANYFILKYKDDYNIYHYDVDIVFLEQFRIEAGDTSDSDTGGKGRKAISKKSSKSVFEQGRTAKEDAKKKVSHVEHQQKRAPGKQRCRDIISRMCDNERLSHYNPVYDGQKNLYTTKELNIPEKEGKKFTIRFEEEGRVKIFEVTLKPVEKKGGGNIISLEPLREVYLGRSKEVPQEVIMAFDTVMCHRNPPHSQIQVGRSFFLLQNQKTQLGEGLEIWYGYNQSVHLTERGPAVIVNFAAKAFHQDGNVIDCASDILKVDIKKLPKLEPYQIKTLEEAFKKVKIEVIHQKYPRRYPVKALTKASARDLRFKPDDRTEVSVADYFRQTYKPLSFPHLPCLHMRTSKNTTYMPMEVCRIYPGQPKLGKLSGQMTASMIRKTAITPAERFDKIWNNAEVIQKVSGQLMNKFGLLMELRFMELQGRVIDSPKLAYKPSERGPSIVCPDFKGTWKIDNKQFVRSKENCTWMILSFANDRFCSIDSLNRFANVLCNSARALGMRLEPPYDIRIFRPRDSTHTALKAAKDARVTFAIVVLSARDLNHSYEEVKYLAEIQLRLLTQCINDEVVVKKCNPQVTTNILLKINSKLGGVNHTLNQKPVILNQPVCIFGADAAHSPRGYACPSIAAVVGSLDAFPARYAVTCRVQQNPDTKKLSQEIIVELKEMTKEILSAFLKNTNGKKPEKIIFFRDGVSEGQFNIVLQLEIEQIQRACWETLNCIPPITFIVVQKRHQTRFRPKDPKNGVGRPGNVPPGTVVDTDIVHPVYFDFFLCSHEGIQGTSKPAHYTVLFDENGFTSDDLQQLCYHLCHMYVRCNRSISIPAPVMYADLACTRAKKYADWWLKTHEESVSSVSSDEVRELPEEMVRAISDMRNFESGMFYV